MGLPNNKPNYVGEEPWSTKGTGVELFSEAHAMVENKIDSGTLCPCPLESMVSDPIDFPLLIFHRTEHLRPRELCQKCS